MTAAVFPQLSIGMLSFGAPATLRRTLASHTAVGLLDTAGEAFIHFNAITPEDRALAAQYSLPAYGTADNRGIYGGFRAIAERATGTHLLILENDLVAAPEGEAPAAAIGRCLADMAKHGIDIFALGLRRPGQTNAKYDRCFARAGQSLNTAAAAQLSLSRMAMQVKHLGIDKLRGRAIMIEDAPEIAQPRAVRRLPSGNYATSGRYRNWGNQAVLVRRDVFIEIVCGRVESHPDPRFVNGYQDIERALNCRWWRRLDLPMGHAARGLFVHSRIDR